MEKLKHLISTPPEAIKYTYPRVVIADNKAMMPREHKTHGDFLQQRFNEAWSKANDAYMVHHVDRSGLYLQVKGEPGFALAVQSLESLRNKNPKKNPRLLNVRKEIITDTTGDTKTIETTMATIYVPLEEKNFLLDKIIKYSNDDKEKPRNATLLANIADIKDALNIESFWTDDKSLIPTDKPQWCEVWLRSNDYETIVEFEGLLKRQNINFKSGYIMFPERAVKLAYVDEKQLARIIHKSDDIAEFRLAKETAAYWLDIPNKEQAEWVKSMLERLSLEADSKVSICVLDTGVNQGHPLLSPLLSIADCTEYDESWGSHDHHGHGTSMAGICAYNNLQQILEGRDPVHLTHCLESAKILPPKGQNEPNLWGHITAQALAKVEIQAPERNRVTCMAVTASDARDQGHPSSWSGMLDQLCSGAEDDQRRLIIVSAGNSEFCDSSIYPDCLLTDSIHDPAQAWNVLTVGAYTQLDTIKDKSLAGYRPVAQANEISPFTTTSNTWDDTWPLKPELVLEGGNLAKDQKNFITECDDLSLLSTHRYPHKAHFTSFRMTSAATAQAAWMAAQLQAQYPDYWPETVRGLLVHSADWPQVLKEQLCEGKRKKDYRPLLRSCGYGVPDLQKALYSARNRLTLISQEELQPFGKNEKGSLVTQDMHLYNLPWPKEALLDLPDGETVKMRVTLSYFVEPGPGEIGWKDRYSYASHGLRFDLNSPGESQEEFLQRINKAARDEGETEGATSESSAKYWLLGENLRNKGSIHSDIWQGTAAELANSNLIAVYPVTGWWKARRHLQKWEQRARYALIVSIGTSAVDVDIYTPVKIALEVPLSITV